MGRLLGYLRSHHIVGSTTAAGIYVGVGGTRLEDVRVLATGQNAYGICVVNGATAIDDSTAGVSSGTTGVGVGLKLAATTGSASGVVRSSTFTAFGTTSYGVAVAKAAVLIDSSALIGDTDGVTAAAGSFVRIGGSKVGGRLECRRKLVPPVRPRLQRHIRALGATC
jgi:hypothetical protein